MAFKNLIEELSELAKNLSLTELIDVVLEKGIDAVLNYGVEKEFVDDLKYLIETLNILTNISSLSIAGPIVQIIFVFLFIIIFTSYFFKSAIYRYFFVYTYYPHKNQVVN